MFFEGAEKRIKLICLEGMREKYNKRWWKHHIKDIGCNILSMISNNFYDIYLLSESILLVGTDKIIIKTCGITSPLEILKIIDKQYIKNIIYTNPIFIRPEEQPIEYQNLDNVKNYINKYIDIDLYCFDKLFLNVVANKYDENHNEIILWDFKWDDKFINIIRQGLKEWLIDDYIFQPQGYSLNGCKNDQYITIHSTPNEECSYISIEYNGNIKMEMILEIIYLLKPKKVGLVTKNIDLFEQLNLENSNYIYVMLNETYFKYYS